MQQDCWPVPFREEHRTAVCSTPTTTEPLLLASTIGLHLLRSLPVPVVLLTVRVNFPYSTAAQCLAALSALLRLPLSAVAEMSEDPSRHEYRATSNLVINVDNRQRGEIGPSSEVQSLAGKKDARTMMAEMGSRAKHAANDNKAANRPSRPASSDDDRQPKRAKQSHSASALLATAPASLATAVDVYRPQTAETRRVYDTLLAHIATLLPSINQHDTLTSAAYELLLVLKQANTTIKEQRQQAEALLNKHLNDEQWRLLVNITQRITDFDIALPATNSDGRPSAEMGGEVDERVGVSVLLDEVDEDEGDGDGGARDDNNDAIRDEDSEHEQDVDDDGEDDENDDTIDDSIDTATDTVLQRKSNKHAQNTTAATDTLNPMLEDDDLPPLDRPTTATATAASAPSAGLDGRAIDAYWIQRQITAFTPDALTSQSLAQSAFTALSTAQLTDGAVETALVSLLGFERFGLIKLLVSNRWSVVYATRLARAG